MWGWWGGYCLDSTFEFRDQPFLNLLFIFNDGSAPNW